MKGTSQHPDFSASQKIYGRLMLAYPRSHRAKYGAAMAQLFRDQCRDAWSESRTWGLLTLWLRILPDLASTSFLERLAALNERKTMSDKLANLFSFRTTPTAAFWRAFVLVFLLVFLASVAITNLLPEAYASTARIKVENDNAATPGATAGYDPYFLQATFAIIQSQVVLNPVIDKLKLNTMWGNKYNAGTPLRTQDTMQLLKRRMNLNPERNTKLINITVYGEDRNEAAKIANAITESYRDYRDKLERQKLQTPILKHPVVTIVDAARPGMRPVRPNKTLDIVLGMVIGILLGLIIGAGAAGVASLFRRRSHGDGPKGKPNIPPGTIASCSTNDEFRSGSLRRIVGILWMGMSGILCGLGLCALFSILVNGPTFSEALFVSIFGIFWAGNATAGFFLSEGRSWAKTTVAVVAAVCATSGLMTWRLFAMIVPLPQALHWPFTVFALFTACVLLWFHRRTHIGTSPAA